MKHYIIDAHSHLWLKQDTVVNGKRISPLPNGRCDFMGEERQMLPPFMIDGRNTAEVFLSNMDYAQVAAAVVVQEFIDGEQNEYLMDVKCRFPDRFFVFGMADFRKPEFYEKAVGLMDSGFKGLAIPAHRLPLGDTDTVKQVSNLRGVVDKPSRVWLNGEEMMRLFKEMERRGAILSITLADGDTQVAEMREVIQECPNLKIAIGHFGMVTTERWQEQVKLASAPNVMVESGGITWLFNSEFYPYPSAIKAIREAADLVGFDKLMWGSDYPRTITAITYKMSYDFVTKSKELTEEEKHLFLGDNARKFYGFGELPDLRYVKNMSE